MGNARASTGRKSKWYRLSRFSFFQPSNPIWEAYRIQSSIMPAKSAHNPRCQVRQSYYSFLYVILSFILFSPAIITAQTYRYKRIMIVNKGGQKTQCNDDEHYITFTSNGLYESDKNGYKQPNCDFIGHTFDKDGYHNFYGLGYHGKSNFFFNSDYSRLNVKVVSTGTTYVYVRETGTSNATKRGIQQSVTGSITTGSPINLPHLNTNSGSTASKRRECTACRGTGKGIDRIEYSTNYSGNDNSTYCSTCGRYMDRHVHIQQNCGVCHGKGYTEY